MDSYNAIPIFVAVAQTGSFSGAAKKLELSKSAVSKRITLLENQLQARLIHRTTRKLSLTEAGERFYEHAKEVMQAAQNAEDAVAQLQGEPYGKLKIQAPMSFGVLHIAPLIALFLKRFTQLEIDLVLDDKEVDIVANGYDICIRAGELKDSSLIARPLAPLRSVLCMSPDYPAITKLVQPEDLSQENCILYRYSQDAAYWRFSKDGEQQVKVSGNYRVNNSEALQKALISGAGIGRLPSFVAASAIQKGTLVTLFDDYEMPAKRLFAIYPERHYVPVKVRVFIDFVIEFFGVEQPYWDKALAKSNSSVENIG
ncbi:MAG: LysR family transcriptional regulator [Oceanospirillaceae bacterium]